MEKLLVFKKPFFMRITGISKNRQNLVEHKRNIIKVDAIYFGSGLYCKNTCTIKPKETSCRRCKKYFLRGTILADGKRTSLAAVDYTILTETELVPYLL
jgi:hypothetical protein